MLLPAIRALITTTATTFDVAHFSQSGYIWLGRRGRSSPTNQPTVPSCWLSDRIRCIWLWVLWPRKPTTANAFCVSSHSSWRRFRQSRLDRGWKTKCRITDFPVLFFRLEPVLWTPVRNPSIISTWLLPLHTPNLNNIDSSKRCYLDCVFVCVWECGVLRRRCRQMEILVRKPIT